MKQEIQVTVPEEQVTSFRHYILTRKYHQGRGSRAGWAFVAHALGDPDLPNVASWRELRHHLVASGAEKDMIAAANIVWRSYVSHISRERRGRAGNVLTRWSGVAAVPVPIATESIQGRSCASVAD